MQVLLPVTPDEWRQAVYETLVAVEDYRVDGVELDVPALIGLLGIKLGGAYDLDAEELGKMVASATRAVELARGERAGGPAAVSR